MEGLFDAGQNKRGDADGGKVVTVGEVSRKGSTCISPDELLRLGKGGEHGGEPV